MGVALILEILIEAFAVDEIQAVLQEQVRAEVPLVVQFVVRLAKVVDGVPVGLRVVGAVGA